MLVNSEEKIKDGVIPVPEIPIGKMWGVVGFCVALMALKVWILTYAWGIIANGIIGVDIALSFAEMFFVVMFIGVVRVRSYDKILQTKEEIDRATLKFINGATPQKMLGIMGGYGFGWLVLWGLQLAI